MKYITVDRPGDSIIAEILKDLLSKFGEIVRAPIRYGEIGENSGICFSPDSGAKVISETEDILGNRKQQCSYPFFIVYRVASEKEAYKIRAAQLLDLIGRWICGEIVEFNNETYKIQLPKTTNGRTIKKIVRENFYPQTPREDGVQDWILPVRVDYENIIEG